MGTSPPERRKIVAKSGLSAIGGPGVHDHLRSGRRRAAIFGTLWASANSFVPAAVGILVFTITSRVLTPTDFGLVALAGGIAMVGSALAPAGFGQALVQRSTIQRRHLDTVFTVLMIFATVAYGVLALAAPLIQRLLGEEELAPLILVLGMTVVFNMALVVPNAMLIRTMSFRTVALRTAIVSLVAAVVCLSLLWLDFGYWALAASQVATAAANAAGALLSVRWRPRLSIDRPALRELARFGIFASGGQIFALLRTDDVLIGVLMGPASLGIFAFARRVHMIVNDVVGGALNQVSYSLLSALQDEPDKRAEAFLLATFLSCAVSFPLFAGMAVLAPEFVPLVFGNTWGPAVPAVQGFATFGLLSCVGILQASLINSAGHPGRWFLYLLGKNLATLLVIVLTFRAGISVVVWSIVMMSFFMWPIAVAMVIAILKISPFAYLKQFVPPLAATLIMVATVVGVAVLLEGSDPIVRIAAEIAGGAAVYAAALAILCAGRVRQLVALLRARRRP